MNRVARRGPLARAPGALKGDTSEIVNIFVQLKGGPFGEKQIFEKKSHNAEKLKGDPLGFLNTHSVLKYQKIEVGKNVFFSKKNLTVPKKTERGALSSRPVWDVTREIRKNPIDSVR